MNFEFHFIFLSRFIEFFIDKTNIFIKSTIKINFLQNLENMTKNSNKFKNFNRSFRSMFIFSPRLGYKHKSLAR